MNNQIVSLYAYGLIILAGIIGAVMIFSSANAYYMEKTAQYTSEGLAYQLQAKVAVAKRIGKTEFIKNLKLK